MKKIEGLSPVEYIWTDKKRILGMPISFTRYSLSEDRLFVRRGVFTTTEDETLLYRVRDLAFKQTLGQKLFGVGTVTVHSSDKTSPHFDLKNIKMPKEVKELIHKNVEIQKKKNKVRSSEFMMADDDGLDLDGDGIPD